MVGGKRIPIITCEQERIQLNIGLYYGFRNKVGLNPKFSFVQYSRYSAILKPIEMSKYLRSIGNKVFNEIWHPGKPPISTNTCN